MLSNKNKNPAKNGNTKDQKERASGKEATRKVTNVHHVGSCVYIFESPIQHVSMLASEMFLFRDVLVAESLDESLDA